jgi:hypothetical protein
VDLLLCGDYVGVRRSCSTFSAAQSCNAAWVLRSLSSHGRWWGSACRAGPQRVSDSGGRRQGPRQRAAALPRSEFWLAGARTLTSPISYAGDSTPDPIIPARLRRVVRRAICHTVGFAPSGAARGHLNFYGRATAFEDLHAERPSVLLSHAQRHTNQNRYPGDVAQANACRAARRCCSYNCRGRPNSPCACLPRRHSWPSARRIRRP